MLKNHRYKLLVSAGQLISIMTIVLLVACGPAGTESGRDGWTDVSAGVSSSTATIPPADNLEVEEDAASIADQGAAVTFQSGLEVAPGSQEVDANGLPVGFTSEGFAFRGDPQAPIVMEEFSDYQCPFCNRFVQETLPSLETNQIATGEVVLVYYDFPLSSIHPQAPAAHEAAYCAGEEGAAAYWAMHDALFANLNGWAGQSNTTDLFTG